MPLVKALFRVLDDDAIDPARGLLPVFPVMFNPEKVVIEKAAQYSEIPIPGLDAPVQNFVRGQAESITMDLFFDSTTLGGFADGPAVPVNILSHPIYQLVKVQPRTHAPPRVQFIWGGGLNFRGVAQQVRREFLMFNPQGIPVRANVSVTFRETQVLEDQLRHLNLQSPDHQKTAVTRIDEPMSRLANDKYGDPRAWKVIANANPAVDPLEPPIGEELDLPRLDGRRGERGR